MKKKLILATCGVVLIGFTGLGITNIRHSNIQVQLREVQLKDNSVKLKKLNQNYDQLLNSKQVDQQKLEELQKQKDQLEKDLQAKVQRKNAEQIALQKVADEVEQVVAPAKAYAEPANCDSPKACIYAKESSNNPSAVNSIGCRGIGQACPGTKLPCGADYACQDAWFTNYAVQRYGSWAGAWAFWQQHHWW